MEILGFIFCILIMICMGCSDNIWGKDFAEPREIIVNICGPIAGIILVIILVNTWKAP